MLELRIPTSVCPSPDIEILVQLGVGLFVCQVYPESIDVKIPTLPQAASRPVAEAAVPVHTPGGRLAFSGWEYGIHQFVHKPTPPPSASDASTIRPSPEQE